jgi:hypothetical protein
VAKTLWKTAVGFALTVIVSGTRVINAARRCHRMSPLSYRNAPTQQSHTATLQSKQPITLFPLVKTFAISVV